MTFETAAPTTAAWPELLLAWYARAARSLPWRDRQDDPYAIWISEIMLQQTTVAAVIPFYLRWLEAFPTVQALADARLDDVLRHSSGLGYYARARNLKRAAEVIVQDYNGGLPDTVDELMKLPGIGRYTAGAIASIAYQVNAPILDANVIRVLCRVHWIDGDIDAASTKAQLWDLAVQDIPDGRARHFNQALMELGALICLPAAPKCASCPLQTACRAFSGGDPTALPVRSKKVQWVSVTDCAVVVEHEEQDSPLCGGRINGLWGGLWEVPRATLQLDESLEQCAARAISERTTLDIVLGSRFGEHAHTVINRRIALVGFRAMAENDFEPTRDGAALVAPSEIERYALASPQKALLALWDRARRQPSLDI